MIELSPCCPGCRRTYRPGQEACSHCGRLLESIAAEEAKLDGFPVLKRHGPKPELRTAFSIEVAGEEVVKFRGRRARRIEIGGEPLIIGRRDPRSGTYPDVDLQDLSDYGYTSRRHARLHQVDGRLFVTDLKGLDTTAIGDASETIPGNHPVELNDGDRLVIGEAVTFVIERECD